MSSAGGVLQIGHAIKVLRTSRKLSQRELAFIIGVTESYVCLIENDRRMPHWATLCAFAQALQVPVSLICQLAEAHPDKFVQELLRDFES